MVAGEARGDDGGCAVEEREAGGAEGVGSGVKKRVSLQALYRIHDELEAALRTSEMPESEKSLPRMRSRVWAAHDELERVIVKEEASRR